MDKRSLPRSPDESLDAPDVLDDPRRSYAVAPFLGGIELLSGTYRSHRFTPHAHDTAAIGVVRHGEAVFIGGGERFVLRPGSVLVVPPRVIHDAMTVGSEGRWEYRALYLDTPQIDAIARDLGDGEGVLGARPFVLHGGEAAERVMAVHGMLTRCAMHDERPADAPLAELRTLLHTLQERARAFGGAGAEGPLAASVARVRRAVDEAPLERRSLADMARMAGVSRFTFAHAFTRAYGVSPHAYMLQRRIAVVREMLVAGAPVSRVAHSVGFADQSHLTRRFSAVVGVTPGEFRRAWGRVRGCAPASRTPAAQSR